MLHGAKGHWAKCLGVILYKPPVLEGVWQGASFYIYNVPKGHAKNMYCSLCTLLSLFSDLAYLCYLSMIHNTLNFTGSSMYTCTVLCTVRSHDVQTKLYEFIHWIIFNVLPCIKGTVRRDFRVFFWHCLIAWDARQTAAGFLIFHLYLWIIKIYLFEAVSVKTTPIV
jgi:hypothetical protein